MTNPFFCSGHAVLTRYCHEHGVMLGDMDTCGRCDANSPPPVKLPEPITVPYWSFVMTGLKP